MRAREIMTKSVLTVLPTATVGKASEMLTYRGFSALPVVDAQGTLVGIVTEADLIRNRFPEQSGDPAAVGQSPARMVADVMTAPAVAVSHDAEISVLARVMLGEHRRCVPIVDGTRLVGVVTRRDMVRVLSRTDEEIAADVRKHLQVLGGQARWSVQVTDGEVIVRDLFEEASDRPVAQVLTEAVPGVIRASVQAPEPRVTPAQA
jgi:CBS domain-containing protein